MQTHKGMFVKGYEGVKHQDMDIQCDNVAKAIVWAGKGQTECSIPIIKIVK